jgi:hypothetical protein
MQFEKMRITLLIFGILVIISCKRNVENKAELKTKNSNELKTESKLDTLNADNYNLLFFHPNETDFEELLKEYGEERDGLYEVDSDFGFYANKVYDSISKTDLKVKIVTERIIKYSTKSGIKYLDRLKNVEHPYGIIFNNVNCEPRIVFGIMTDVGIFQELAEYNKNCM